ncbi:hypothetical protein Scep_010344 [Stephania cephalantha]|uniref:Ubiquinone biosynthesis monooxygenase COQ6, mitochondrial n=1 Tax=Stephania cephalantha TaxID=152367 RepID=A0AAP0PD88_9MAGN
MRSSLRTEMYSNVSVIEDREVSRRSRTGTTESTDNFPDYNDTFTPSKPFPYREAAISWLQMIGGENKFVLVTKRSDAGALSAGEGENCQHNHDTARRLDKGKEEVEDAGEDESERLGEISPPSSFVECEREVEDAGGRTPGSPIGGTPVSKRKHDDDDSSTRRVESGFESSHSTKRHPLLGEERQEPDWLPHVEAIIDVVSDGNCGYRCVASGLALADVDGWRIVRRRMYDEIIGYEDLWREVLGSSFETVKNAVHCPEKQEGASFKEWLTLPDMGLLVSTAFNVILVNLSHGSASTFLPLRSTPPSSLHNRLIIAMANEKNIHWVRVCDFFHICLMSFTLSSSWELDEFLLVLMEGYLWIGCFADSGLVKVSEKGIFYFGVCTLKVYKATLGLGYLSPSAYPLPDIHEHTKRKFHQNPYPKIRRRVSSNVPGLRVPIRCLTNGANAGGANSTCDAHINPEQNKSTPNNELGQYDIAIVGGGMVGMAFACALRSIPLTKHLNVAIIDSNPALGKKEVYKQLEIPTARFSSRSPYTFPLFKNVGAWEYVLQHRHAFFDKMQVWDYTGLGYTKYCARDVGRDILGCVVENKVLHKALFSSLEDAEFQKAIHPSRLTSMDIQSKKSTKEVDQPCCSVKLDLSDGNTIYSKLVVGADGARSRVRDLAGLKTIGWSYKQNAVICTVEHAVENYCAWQRFLPNGPIALLPIGDKFSNIVWTMSPNESTERTSMSENDFVKAVNHALNDGYGPHPSSSFLGYYPGDSSWEVPPKVVKLVSDRMAFPLSLLHAKDYASDHVVLIGDAAHSVHPLAGQGVNLGFGDALALAKVIADGIGVGAELGELSVLKNYEAERKPANTMMAAILDGFQKAYSVDLGPLNVLRAVGFRMVHHISPLKKSIISYATGEQKWPLFG